MHCTPFGILSVISVCSCFASGCVGIDGNGRRARETRELDSFSQIVSHGPFEVDVEQGEGYSARISIDSNLIEHLRTEVRGDELEIDSDVWIDDLLPGPHVVVTLPELERAEVTGSGELTIQGFDCRSALRLQASGSSDLYFEGSAPKIKAQVSGSGDVYLQGTTEFAELSVSGSGNMDAHDLVAAEGDVSVTGSGRLTATVDGPVNASASGSGDIDLYGEVQRERFSETGSGDIHVH